MADSSDGLRIELLGPVEARVGVRTAALGGQRPRALLALLALSPGRVVTADRLIDGLWGEAPPARARESLQMHVSRLRKGMADAGVEPGRLFSHAGGYRLEVRPGERDVDHWEHALARARRARTNGEPRVARAGFDEALGVWRGQPLAGVSPSSLLSLERARLEEERLAAVVEGLELDLELGCHSELLGQLDALVLEHPFMERLVELQMLALYRCGRQADALAAFQAARGRFVEALGIEPAQPLRDLQQRVLRHADELRPPDRTAARKRPESQTISDRRLPVPPNRTIGREQDIVAVAERLRSGSVRLLTLTGAGGVGKTRLAVEAARAVRADFTDGAQFVSLAPLRRPEDVPAALVATLGIIPLSRETAEQAVERFLAAKRLLLVTDNFEHLPGAATFIAGLLEACPSLTVLTTSREPLALQAEECHPVSPLALPEPRTSDDPQALAGAHAVALFCERARAHDAAFGLSDANAWAVAEICRRVDGLPLAIELAAARCGLLSPEEILTRLELALDAMGAGARDTPARHRTLRATIDWSHALLSAEEQRCFARFAVFAGGATIDAAETITGASLHVLEGLVTKNLLVRRRQEDASTRLGMLETIRAYAGTRLASAADAEAVREQHHALYLALAEHHGDHRALRGAGAGEHLARLDADIDNLHAALRWAVAQPSARRALALANALSVYWVQRHRYAEAVDWLDRALSLPGADTHAALRIRALLAKARCLWPAGRGAEQVGLLASAEADARRLGDPVILSQVLQSRVFVEVDAEHLALADALADEALDLARATGDDWEVAEALRGKALAATTIEELRERVEAAASRLAEVGGVNSLAHLLSGSAYAALCLGSERDATDLAMRARPLTRSLPTRDVRMFNSGNLGLAALLTGETDAALEAFREELTLCRDLVVRPVAFEGLRGLAAVAVVNGDDRRAATLAGAADAHRYDMPQDPLDAKLTATFFEPARERYGPASWDADALEGSALSFESAIAYALTRSEADSSTSPGRAAIT